MAENPYLSPTQQKFNYLVWDYDRAVAAVEDDRDRVFENMGLYWGVDYSQWDKNVVQGLLDENREPVTLNVVSQKINTLAGSMKANPFNVEFISIDGSHTDIVQNFKDIYLSDKHLMKWDASSTECLIHGLALSVGVEQMVIDKEIDPEGHIKFETRQPGLTVFDPYWKTRNPKDCKKAWCVYYLTLDEISRIYDIPKKTLQLELQITKMQGTDYQKTTLKFGENLEDYYGSLFNVIEYHEMRTIKTTRLVDYSKGMNGLPFPIVDDPDSEEGQAYLKAWGNKNKVNWDAVETVPATKEVLWITAFCKRFPRFFFMDKRADIQVGRLDLFPYAPDRMNGKNRGIGDIMKDAQQLINKHQTQKQHMIDTAATGGTLLNSNLTDGDMERMEDIKNNWNNSGYIDDVDLDSVKTPFIKLKDNSYDAAIFQDQQILFDIMDLISPVPAAMSSRTESSRESGVLYQSKIAIAEVGMRTLYDSWRQHEYDKAMAYVRQAQVTYRDKYRRFPKIASQGELMPNEFIEINKEIAVDGVNTMMNDISQMPLCDVILKEDQNGLINRHMKRLSYAEIIRVVPPENQLLRTWWTTKLNETFEMDDYEREVAKKIGNMEMALAIKRAVGEMSNIEASQAQAEMLIKQLMGGQPQQMGLPPQGGGPRPVEPSQEEVNAQLTPAPPGGPSLLPTQ